MFLVGAVLDFPLYYENLNELLGFNMCVCRFCLSCVVAYKIFNAYFAFCLANVRLGYQKASKFLTHTHIYFS